MNTPWDANFSPGTGEADPEETFAWEMNPAWRREMLLEDGKAYVFWTLSALGAALNRSPITLRGWERAGTLPPPTWEREGVTSRGRRRLYTSDQLSQARRIAEETGVLNAPKTAPVPEEFTLRIRTAWVQHNQPTPTI